MARNISPLRYELMRLNQRYSETELELNRFSDNFWENNGICCPGCGVPGYSDLQDKQYRRLIRMDELRVKLILSDINDSNVSTADKLDIVLQYFEQRRAKLQVKMRYAGARHTKSLARQIERIQSKARKSAIMIDTFFVQQQDFIQEQENIQELPLLWDSN